MTIGDDDGDDRSGLAYAACASDDDDPIEVAMIGVASPMPFAPPTAMTMAMIRSVLCEVCGFLILSWVLCEVAAPLLEKIPCQFQFFLSFFFVSLCEFVEYVNWVCSISNIFQLGFCQLGLVVVALLG